MTMTGYFRSLPATEGLTAALVTALREHQNERLGQLVCNALGVHSPELFMMHDELIEQKLRDYCENEANLAACLYGDLANGGCALAATVDSPPPSSVQVLDLLRELDEERSKSRTAIALVDQFDRHSSSSEGYHGSPFEDEVIDFLTTLGMRS